MTVATPLDHDGLPSGYGPFTFQRGALVSALSTASDGTGTLHYGYDDDGRLLEVRRNGSVVETYAYDDDGNRTSARSGASPAEAATYGPGDVLLTRGAVTYEHTAAGMLSRRGTDTFAYGVDGELISVTVGATTVRYGYDGRGRRTSRTDGGGTTKYLYGDLTRPDLPSAIRTSDGVMTVLYYDDFDQVIGFERGGQRFYVAADQVGSPRVVTNAAGAVVKTVSYDSFGRVLSDSAPGFVLPIGFAGGLADAATGLVHFSYRDYDPDTGRFTVRDPLLFAGGQGNLFAYVGSDPVGRREFQWKPK